MKVARQHLLIASVIWCALCGCVALFAPVSNIVYVEERGRVMRRHETLWQHSDALVVASGVALLLAIALSALDLHRLAKQDTERQSVLCITVGGCICLFSLFGLIFGAASIGVVGALILLAGLQRSGPSQNAPSTTVKPRDTTR